MRARQSETKHLCLIIDDSFSMNGAPIKKVREHCERFGEKFFKENGKKITLIKFGSNAKKSTFTDLNQLRKEL